MANIALQDGKVVTKDGKVSCACCGCSYTFENGVCADGLALQQTDPCRWMGGTFSGEKSWQLQYFKSWKDSPAPLLQPPDPTKPVWELAGYYGNEAGPQCGGIRFFWMNSDSVFTGTWKNLDWGPALNFTCTLPLPVMTEGCPQDPCSTPPTITIPTCTTDGPKDGGFCVGGCWYYFDAACCWEHGCGGWEKVPPDFC
jgi:hypothetical protein